MSFGDFASMFSKMKETFSQAFNLKSINKEIKLISEQFQSLIQLDQEKIKEITNYGEYELNYSPPLNNSNENKEIIESNNLLYLALVSFHQKKGSVVELTYPSLEDIKNNKSNDLLSLIDENSENNNNIDSIINTINSQIINYSLMDGIHLVDKDTQIYFLHNLKKPIYCLSYYVQVKTGNGNPEKEDSFQENVRECIQKAICIISLKPIFIHKILYQHFYTHLKNEMDSFMAQKSLNDKSKLDNLYKTLSQDIIIFDSNNEEWGFNIRKLFCFLKNDIFNIIKLILCEQNILVFSQIPSNVSLFIITLLYILPAEISQILSNYEYQNASPFKLFHKDYLIYPLFCLFDLTPLIEKMKKNDNLHYICGTTNFLVAKSKEINYACFIDLDELTINYNENIESNLIYNNSTENKIIEEINKEISLNINKENNNKFDSNKRCNIEENWILDRNKCKEDYLNESKFIIKKIREYIMSIVFDMNYLINEIKFIKENNDENKATIKIKKMNEIINNNYFKLINSNQEEKNTNIIIEKKIEESSSTIQQIEKEKEEDFLPRIDELISEPYIYLLNSKLSFSINNQIEMGIIASPQKTDIPKDIHSPLSDLNILYFISYWLKTKNFQNWFLSKTKEQNDKITKLSPLNSTKTTVNKLYDFDDNEFSGTILFGRKNGKGKVIYTKKNMVFVGIFINDLREMKGNLSSFDNKYLYDGEWKNDKFEGNGSLVTPDGNKYVGQFKNGLFEGNGYLIDNEGNIYNGSFKQGKKWGEGELSMNNGNKFTGMFKQDKFNGKGKLVDKDGKVLQEGNFKDGILVVKKKKDKDKDKKDVDDIEDKQKNTEIGEEKKNKNEINEHKDNVNV